MMTKSDLSKFSYDSFEELNHLCVRLIPSVVCNYNEEC